MVTVNEIEINNEDIIANLSDGGIAGIHLQQNLELEFNMLQDKTSNLENIANQYWDSRGIAFFLIDLVSLLQSYRMISHIDSSEKILELTNSGDLHHNSIQGTLVNFYASSFETTLELFPNNNGKKPDFAINSILSDVKILQGDIATDFRQRPLRLYDLHVMSMMLAIRNKISDGMEQTNSGCVFLDFALPGISQMLKTTIPNLEPLRLPTANSCCILLRDYSDVNNTDSCIFFEVNEENLLNIQNLLLAQRFQRLIIFNHPSGVFAKGTKSVKTMQISIFK